MKFVNPLKSTFTLSPIDGINVQDPPYYIFLLLNYHHDLKNLTVI